MKPIQICFVKTFACFTKQMTHFVKSPKIVVVKIQTLEAE
jgi:hypothetical protein